MCCPHRGRGPEGSCPAQSFCRMPVEQGRPGRAACAVRRLPPLAGRLAAPVARLVVTGLFVTEPAATVPAVMAPAVTEPAATGLAATGLAATEPSVTAIDGPRAVASPPFPSFAWREPPVISSAMKTGLSFPSTLPAAACRRETDQPGRQAMSAHSGPRELVLIPVSSIYQQ